MKKILILLFAAFALFSPAVVLAHKDKDDNSSKFQLKIESHDQDDDEDDNGNLEVGGSGFEIRGEISSISGNSFTILGQTIVVDPSQISEFKQKGILKVGSMAKVEGKIVNGTKYAKEIKVIGTGQGRFKFEIEGVTFPAGSSPSPSPSPIPSPSPTSNIDASPSPSPSPSSEPTATPSANVAVKIKASGPVDQVIEFLNQILSFLENII